MYLTPLQTLVRNPRISRTLVMGVLNVTPDSFSDGGLYAERDAAIARALEMLDEGADFIDVGGESTRPATFSDHSPLDPEDEKRRILPVIKGIVSARPSAVVSVDTYKADVAEAALDAGAKIVNDISGLTFDSAMVKLLAKTGAPFIMMHILGKPRDIPLMPHYDDVVVEIIESFRRLMHYADSEGHRFQQNHRRSGDRVRQDNRA